VSADVKSPTSWMPLCERWFPWAAVGICALYILVQAIPPSEKKNDFDLQAASTITVQDEGRFKPLDSLARVSLMAISSRSEFEDDNRKMQPAMRWLLDVMSSDAVDPLEGRAAGYKVFRIENDQVLSFLNLEKRPGSYRYSFREIFSSREKVMKIGDEFDRVSERPAKKQTIYEQKIAELSAKIRLYQNLQRRVLPLAIPPQENEKRWRSLAEIDEEIVDPVERTLVLRLQQKIAKENPKIFEDVQRDFVEELTARGINIAGLTEADKQHYVELIRERYRDAVNAEAKRLFPAAARDYANANRAEEHPAADSFAAILRAWEARDVSGFNSAVKYYRETYLNKAVPAEDARKSNYETMYNRFSAFYHCAALFIIAFVLGCASWLGWSKPLNRASMYVGLLALGVHSAAMLMRMYLQGRPPVTNLYSSAIFIGWGGVGVCLLLERIYQNGVGNVVGSLLGFGTMIIAHHLGMGKDTLEKLEAVLDTNFWLATHVTTVTLGYMATFIAGFIGIYYIGRGMFTTTMTPERSRATMSMLYGILCFATLLSFVGTVLGGIWADQSWGRFWGWDPKENGAVLIVLWNALVLHARWSGLAKHRGIAVLAVIGNIITFWSWFGTNQLQIGLHSYGRDSSLVYICRYFWLVMLAIVAVGLLPTKYWRSFSEETQRARVAEARERSNRERPRMG
jgi:ABC-type transport system involved in cytochrome c biogenesis permease subunit